MRMYQRTRSAALAAGLVLAASMPLWAQRSAYQDLDPKELAEALRDRGMTELLSALSESLKSGVGKATVDALAISVQTKINLATQPNVPEARRNELLDEAAKILEEIVDRTKKALDCKAIMAHLRFRFELANVIGIVQAEPYAVKLLFLQGDPNDRAFVRQRAQKASKVLELLNEDIESTIQEWRLDRKKLVTWVPELEEFQKQVRYKSAWVYFYSGMSLPNTEQHRDERLVRLQDAIRGVDEWAEGDPGTGVKHWSLLLRGMALRELGQFPSALSSLQAAAAAEKAEKVVRMRACFDAARTRIESGDFQGAPAAIGEFLTQVEAMYGQQGRFAIDLYAAMLWDHLYDRQAARDKQNAAALKEKAVRALLEVPAKHSDWAEQAHWARVVRGKYGEDAEGDPAVLYAGVMGPLGQWRELRSKGAPVPKELKDKVLRKLDKMLDPNERTFPSARKFARPMALWRKAFIMNWERLNDKAGDLFLEIAKDKDHPLARQAAEFSARSYLGVIRERVRTRPGEQVHPRLRKGLIAALEALLAGWAKTADGKWDPKVTEWHEEVGLQYDRLVWITADLSERLKLMAKAVEAYEHFGQRAQPKQVPEMRSRHRALELRFAWLQDNDRLVRQQGQEALLKAWETEKAEKARQLEKDLTAYGEKAKALLDGAQGDFAKDLTEWGSFAEFRSGQLLYEVLKREGSAIAKMEALPKRWPGSRVIIDANEFVIRKLIMDQKTPQAIEKLKEFQKTHQDKPERYEQLVAAIIQQLGKRIKELHSFLQRRPEDIQAAEELSRYRSDFHTFAKTLYDRDKDLKLPDRFDVTKLYGNALLEKGAAERAGKKETEAQKHFQAALKLFLECEGLDKGKREVLARKIDENLAETLKAVRAIKTMKQAEQQMKAYLEAVKKKFGAVPEDIAGPTEVQASYAYVDDAKNDAEVAKRLPVFVDKLVRAHEQLAVILKQWLPIDPDVALGLARAYTYSGQYKKAVEYYDGILRGIDASKHPQLYWETELEYCRCAVVGFADEKGTMRALIRRIERLREKAGYRECGLDREFADVKARAQEALKKP